MKNKLRFVIGLILFVVACIAPIIALWRYTGFGLKQGSFKISALVFHSILLGDILLFYVQWKICNDTWLYVRQWLYNHIWPIVFGLTILIVAHSLIFFRYYIRGYARYLNLSDDLGTTISNQRIITDNQARNGSQIRGVANKLEELETKLQAIQNTINNFDVPMKQRPVQRRGWY